MAENKTQSTEASVEAYLDARAKGTQAGDCRALMAMFGRLTGEPPKMWGPSIVGYGSYRYTYESGRSGEAPLVGFAVRGRELVVYLDGDEGAGAVPPALGKFKTGKSCLYFKQLADLDVPVLEHLVVQSMAALKRRYGQA